jgi:hypothetical protein
MTYQLRPISRRERSQDDGFRLGPPEFKFRFERMEERLRPVRCADGFARPRFQCRQLDDGGWEYDKTRDAAP